MRNQRHSRDGHGYFCLQMKRLSFIVPFPDENALIIRQKPILGIEPLPAFHLAAFGFPWSPVYSLEFEQKGERTTSF